MDCKVMMPANIWRGYDPNAEALEVTETGVITQGMLTRTFYLYTALTAEDGKARIQTEVIKREDATFDSPVVLVVGEYHRYPEHDFLMALAQAGYVVVAPDYSRVYPHTLTTYPESYAYGDYAKAGEHIRKVLPTAKETSQYLYSVVIKRAITFVKRNISDGKLILLGMGDAVEVEMQVAGSGGEADAIACLNGAGYREYIKRTRYGGESADDILMDEERMCWLTGVASVAYAKYVKVPTFIALGSNARRSDIDRLSNLKALLLTDDVHIVISPRAGDFLLPEAYKSLLVWLRAVAVDNLESIPKQPTLSIRVNEDGVPYFDVECDTSSMIRSVQVYYASKDYNHEVRDWVEADALSISYSEYIASAEVYDEDEPLFAFVSVEYENGLTISSTVEYLELKGLNVKPGESLATDRVFVIYQAGEEDSGFVEDYDGAVLMESGLSNVRTSLGLEGLTSACGGMRTYRFHAGKTAGRDKILKFEFAAEKEVPVTVALIGVSESGATEYAVKDIVPYNLGYFVSKQYTLGDFKSVVDFMSPASWEDVKIIVVRGDNLTVGNILFI